MSGRKLPDSPEAWAEAETAEERHEREREEQAAEELAAEGRNRALQRERTLERPGAASQVQELLAARRRLPLGDLGDGRARPYQRPSHRYQPGRSNPAAGFCRINLVIDTALRHRLKIQAAEQDLSIAELVESLIEAWPTSNDPPPPPPPPPPASNTARISLVISESARRILRVGAAERKITISQFAEELLR